MRLPRVRLRAESSVRSLPAQEFENVALGMDVKRHLVLSFHRLVALTVSGHCDPIRVGEDTA